MKKKDIKAFERALKSIEKAKDILNEVSESLYDKGDFVANERYDVEASKFLSDEAVELNGIQRRLAYLNRRIKEMAQ